MSYHERRERRRARLEAQATRAEQEAERRAAASDRISERFAGGQPILIGHHSERRARRDLERSHDHMRKSMAARAQAAILRSHAAAVGTGGISSDDPDAITKLHEQLQTCEENQARWKQINRLIRKQDRAGLAALGYSVAAVERWLTAKDYAGRIGIPAYQLTNNAANIRRIKARIAAIPERQAQEAAFTEVRGDGWRMFAEENRLCIAFDTKPSEDIRTRLKSRGFRWARSVGVWQRQFSPGAVHDAKWSLNAP